MAISAPLWENGGRLAGAGVFCEAPVLFDVTVSEVTRCIDTQQLIVQLDVRAHPPGLPVGRAQAPRRKIIRVVE